MINVLKVLTNYIKKEKVFVIFTLFIVLLLSIFKSVYIFNFKYDFNEEYKKYNVDIIEKRSEDDKKITYLVKYCSNKFLLNIYKEKSNENLNFYYGDKIEFIGKINIFKKLNNPYEFNYKRYLNSNNIVGTINTYKIKNVVHTKGNVVYYYILKMKEKVYEIASKNMNQRELSLFKALIYSDKSSISEEDISMFSNNGISHMMAVSGIHITYLMIIIDTFTKDMKKLKKIFIISIFLFSYIVMSSFSVSAIRASIMSIISVIFKDKKGNNKYISIIISFIIIFCINPYVIFNSSFLMSYFATLGIIILNLVIKSYFMIKLKLPRFLESMINSICISICTLIFLFPLQILFFGSINLKAFISNVVISSIISSCYFVSFLLNFLVFIPFINNIIAKALSVILKVTIIMLELLENISVPELNLPRFNLFEIVIYYLAIFLILNTKYIYKYFSKKYWRKLKIISKLLILVIFLGLFSLSIYRIYFENYIWYFNVGQGNMCIIRQNRKTVIYDLGSTTENLGYNVINNFLKAKAIKKIDLVVLSHMHEDHTNAIYKLSKTYEINKVVYPVTYEKTDEYTKVVNLLEERKIGSACVYDGIHIDVGKDIEIVCISPNKDEKILSKDILNSNSLVSIVTIDKKNNYLFMGDATIETEKYILNNNLNNKVLQKLSNIQVIQIGHHGSKTSSSQDFLKIINPCNAVISSEKKIYVHPAKETVELLKKLNFNIIITEEKGAYKAR